MRRVQEQHAHAALYALDYFFDERVRHVFVHGVSPPYKHVRAVKYLVGEHTAVVAVVLPHCGRIKPRTVKKFL